MNSHGVQSWWTIDRSVRYKQENSNYFSFFPRCSVRLSASFAQTFIRKGRKRAAKRCSVTNRSINNPSNSRNHRTTVSTQLPEATDVWRWCADAFRVARLRSSAVTNSSPFVYLQRFRLDCFPFRRPRNFHPLRSFSLVSVSCLALSSRQRRGQPKEKQMRQQIKGISLSLSPFPSFFSPLFLSTMPLFPLTASFNRALWAALHHVAFFSRFLSLFQTYPASNLFSSCWTARRASWDSWTSRTQRWATDSFIVLLSLLAGEYTECS